MSSLGLDDSDGPFDDLSLSGILSKADAYSTTSSLPPHLRHKESTNASASASVASAELSETLSSNGREPSLPPHLVNRVKAMSGAGSSASSTIDMSLPTTLLENDSDADSVVNRSFNAWDPNGMYQRRGRSTADSVDESTDDSVGSESLAETDPNVVGSWDKVAAAPASDPSPRRKGGWVKGPEVSPRRCGGTQAQCLRFFSGDLTNNSCCRRECQLPRFENHLALERFINDIYTGMLTRRSASGQLAVRAIQTNLFRTR